MKKILKKLLPAVIISLAGSFVCICCALTVIPAKCENVSELQNEIVRFRVVANSDSYRDQQLKFAVRDGLESTVKLVFADCSSPEEIKKAVGKYKVLIEHRAEKILEENGEDTDVNVRFVTEEAPVRRYSNLVLPAGEYMTVRVDIGKAEGENWWCVMYPSRYLESAFTEAVSDISDSKGNVSASKTKKIRFALLDLFS